METTFNKTRNQYSLHAAEGCLLHRIGTDDYPLLRHVSTPHPEEWEEIAESDAPTFSKEEYDAEVERLIAERYSIGKEIEINRERDEKPERYADYLAYVQECKARALTELTQAQNESD